MPSEPPSNDPRKDLRNVWQDQPGEGIGMSVEEIRRRSKELHEKMKREGLSNGGILLAIIVFSVWGAAVSADLAQRTAYLLAAAWALIGLYPTRKRLLSPRLAGDAGTVAGLRFYRQELERRRDYVRDQWLWIIGPTLLAIGGFLVPAIRGVLRDPENAPKMAPFTILLVIWMIAFFFIRRKEVRKTQREIDELKSAEREMDR